MPRPHHPRSPQPSPPGSMQPPPGPVPAASHAVGGPHPQPPRRHATPWLAATYCAALLLCPFAARAQDRVEHVIPAITNHTTLTWEWQPQYRVAPAIDGHGAIDGLPADLWADEGPLALEALPDAYHQFDGWTGDTNTTANPLHLHIGHPVTNLTAHFSPVLTDRGTPHQWLARFDLTPEDDDRLMDDGYTVWQHYIADTNPTNPASFFPPLALDALPSGLRLTIDPTSSNRLYHIDAKTNLLDSGWSLQTNAPGTGGPLTIELPPPATSPVFYRSKVTLP